MVTLVLGGVDVAPLAVGGFQGGHGKAHLPLGAAQKRPHSAFNGDTVARDVECTACSPGGGGHCARGPSLHQAPILA